MAAAAPLPSMQPDLLYCANEGALSRLSSADLVHAAARAVVQGDVEFLRELLRVRGKDQLLNLRAHDGSTLLGLAIHTWTMPVIFFLLDEANSPLLLHDSNGNVISRALSESISPKQAIELLLARGASFPTDIDKAAFLGDVATLEKELNASQEQDKKTAADSAAAAASSAAASQPTTTSQAPAASSLPVMPAAASASSPAVPPSPIPSTSSPPSAHVSVSSSAPVPAPAAPPSNPINLPAAAPSPPAISVSVASPSSSSASPAATVISSLERTIQLVLPLAAAGGDLAVLRLLIARSSRLSGEPQLVLSRAARIAVRAGHLEWLRTLLDSLRSTEDHTTQAASEVYRCLLSRVLEVRLHDAVEAGREEIVQWLISIGCDLDELHGRVRPIHVAAGRGNAAMLRCLFKAGAAPLPDAKGSSALHVAAAAGHVCAVEYLVEYGDGTVYPCNEMHASGTSILHRAAAAGQHTVVEWTLKRGMSPSALTLAGCNSVHLALLGCWPRALLSLLSAVPDPFGLLRERTLAEATAFLLAVATGSVPLAQWVRATGADIHATNDRRMGAVIIAAQGKLPMLRWLVQDVKMSLKCASDYGETPLLTAVSSGDIAKVRFLLDAGCSVEAREMGGLTVLHMAAYVGSVPLFELLLRYARSLLLATDFQGYSVLHTAAKHGRLAMVKYLCDTVLSLPALRTRDQLSAAHVAAGAGSIEVFAYLVSPAVGLRPRESTPAGTTPFLFACSRGQQEMAQYLLANNFGAVDERNKVGCTAFILAARQGHIETCKFLLSVGADRSARTNEGASALLEAAREGQVAVCKWLLESGLARVTEKDDNEKSVLMVAANGGHTELCAYLLQASASPLDKARDGKTVMHFAAGSGSVPLLTLFTQAGAQATERDKKNESALHYACTVRKESLPVVRFLCEEAKCDVDALNADGWSPVLLCVAVGHLNVLTYFLSRGVSLHQRTSQSGWTLLHAAAANGQVAMLDMLVRKGISPFTFSTKGELPLTVAPPNSASESRLIELSAEEAVRINDVRTLDTCLRKGVSLSVVGAHGLALAALAEKCGHAEVLDFLVHRRLNSGPDAFRIAMLFIAAAAFAFAHKQ